MMSELASLGSRAGNLREGQQPPVGDAKDSSRHDVQQVQPSYRTCTNPTCEAAVQRDVVDGFVCTVTQRAKHMGGQSSVT
jgi:hypothetical protein